MSKSDERLLARILDTPHFALAIPQLQPEVLQRVIETCGLEDCAELVAYATPEQLACVFDLDLWPAGRPGQDEQLDAGRFGVWLDVLLSAGEELAADKLAAMDSEVIVAALAEHIRVFDIATLPEDRVSSAESCEIAGCLIEARRDDGWDAIVAMLLALDARHQAYLHRVMRGCKRLTNDGFEVDGLDDLLSDRDQELYEVASQRHERREKQGYVAPAQARAFLKDARQFQFKPDAPLPPHPLAQAYFRDLTPESAGLQACATSADEADLKVCTTPDDDSREAAAAITGLLFDAGVIPQPPRGLLAGETSAPVTLTAIQRCMQAVSDRDPLAFVKRTHEYAYLANVLVAGGSVQSRAFTPREASEAVIAACNLALENWPGGAPSDDVLVQHDLITLFQLGWARLHRDVGLYATDRLIAVLAKLRDQGEEDGLAALRVELSKYRRTDEPWRAREALDVIMILDTPAWAVLLGLLDECPVMHVSLAASRDVKARTVDASAFEFIAGNSQVAAIREFFRALPELLQSQA